MSKKFIQQQWQQIFSQGQAASCQVQKYHLYGQANLPVAKSALALGVLVGMSGFSTAALATSNSQQFLSAEALSELDDAMIAAIIRNQQYELNVDHLVTHLDEIKTLEISITTKIQPVQFSETYLVQAHEANDNSAESLNVATQQDKTQSGLASQAAATIIAHNQPATTQESNQAVGPINKLNTSTKVNQGQPLQPKKVAFLPPLAGAVVLAIDPTPVALELTPLRVSRVAVLPPLSNQSDLGVVYRASALVPNQAIDSQQVNALAISTDESLANTHTSEEQLHFGVVQPMLQVQQEQDVVAISLAEKPEPDTNKTVASLPSHHPEEHDLKGMLHRKANTVEEMQGNSQRDGKAVKPNIDTQTDVSMGNTKTVTTMTQTDVIDRNKEIDTAKKPMSDTVSSEAVKSPQNETTVTTDVILDYPMSVKLFTPAPVTSEKTAVVSAHFTPIAVDDLAANTNVSSNVGDLQRNVQAKIYSMTAEVNPSSQIMAASQTVNTEQLQQGLDSTLSKAKAYTNQVASAFGYGLQETQDTANAGTSAAMAMAVMPQAYKPGKTMVAGGVANYNGQSAVAVGVSTLTDNGRWVLKMNGSADTQGDYGIAAGAGMHW